MGNVKRSAGERIFDAVNLTFLTLFAFWRLRGGNRRLVGDRHIQRRHRPLQLHCASPHVRVGGGEEGKRDHLD